MTTFDPRPDSGRRGRETGHANIPGCFFEKMSEHEDDMRTRQEACITGVPLRPG